MRKKILPSIDLEDFKILDEETDARSAGHKSIRDFYKYIRISPEEAGQKIKEIWMQRGEIISKKPPNKLTRDRKIYAITLCEFGSYTIMINTEKEISDYKRIIEKSRKEMETKRRGEEKGVSKKRTLKK